jgi:hypothetical protein
MRQKGEKQNKRIHHEASNLRRLCCDCFDFGDPLLNECCLSRRCRFLAPLTPSRSVKNKNRKEEEKRRREKKKTFKTSW